MRSLLDLISPATWFVAIVAAAVFCLHLNYQEGYDEGFTLAQAQGNTALSQLRLEHAEEKRQAATADATAAKEALAALRTEQDRNDQLAGQLADTKAHLRTTTDKLTGEIARVTTLYRRSLASQPEPLPAAVFTAGFVRVWNSANGISTAVPAQQTQQATGRATAPPNEPGAADSLDSGVTQSMVLANQVRNGELHSVCRAQLNRLIDWTLNATN